MNAKETISRVFVENVASGRISTLCQYCNHPESRSITQNSRLASTFTSSLLFPLLSCDRTVCTGVKLQASSCTCIVHDATRNCRYVGRTRRMRLGCSILRYTSEETVETWSTGRNQEGHAARRNYFRTIIIPVDVRTSSFSHHPFSSSYGFHVVTPRSSVRVSGFHWLRRPTTFNIRTLDSKASFPAAEQQTPLFSHARPKVPFPP